VLLKSARSMCLYTLRRCKWVASSSGKFRTSGRQA